MLKNLFDFKKKYHDVETAIIDDSHEVNEAISKSKKEWHKWDHLTKKTVWIPKEKYIVTENTHEALDGHFI